MLESGLQQLLTADPDVFALVGTRVYPLLWPDIPTFPLVTFQLISTVADNVLSGPLSVTTCRVQFDAWAKSYAEVKTLAVAVIAALEGYQGTLPTGTEMLNVTLDSSFDLYDDPSASYRVSTDLMVTFNR